MSVAEKVLGIGEYQTRDGEPAIVDAVSDGLLVGRVNIKLHDGSPFWIGVVWNMHGKARSHSGSDIGVTVEPRIKASYWLNIYPSGPGLLRKTWEEALIEASRSDEDVIARKEIEIDARVGEGLR